MKKRTVSNDVFVWKTGFLGLGRWVPIGSLPPFGSNRRPILPRLWAYLRGLFEKNSEDTLKLTFDVDKEDWDRFAASLRNPTTGGGDERFRSAGR